MPLVNKMAASEDQFKNLKCRICKYSLTCPPVYLKSEDFSVCGRCKPPEEERNFYIRNKAYEELAKNLKYHCKNHKFGCEETLRFAEVKIHEEKCAFQAFSCPTFVLEQQCTWCGKLEEIESHYMRTHSNLVVNHPYSERLDLKKTQQRNMMFNFNGFVFLLQFRCNVESQKFWICVRLVGDSKLADVFEYNIKLSSLNNCVMSRKMVQGHDYFDIYHDDSFSKTFYEIKNIFGSTDGVSVQIRYFAIFLMD